MEFLGTFTFDLIEKVKENVSNGISDKSKYKNEEWIPLIDLSHKSIL